MSFDVEENFLLSAEQELGAPLPAAYRIAMLRQNRGEIVASGDDW